MSTTKSPRNWFLILFCGLFCGIGGIFFAAGLVMLLAGGDIPLGLSLPFTLMGGLFLAIGLVVLFVDLNKARKRRRLLQNGTAYDAEITNLYYNTSVEVNGRNPLVAECRFVDRYGERYLVKSGSLWKLDAAAVEELRATVYVNPDNPKDHVVDVRWEPAQKIHDLR